MRSKTPKKTSIILVAILLLPLSGCETLQLCQGEIPCQWQTVEVIQCPTWPVIPAELISESSNESVAAKILDQTPVQSLGDSLSKP